MTDNEVVKALECKGNDKMDCLSCPYSPRYPDCDRGVARDAIRLINRQKAEIEKLQRRNKFLEIELRNSANLLSCRMAEEDTEEKTPSVTADAAPPPSEREAYGRSRTPAPTAVPERGGDDG